MWPVEILLSNKSIIYYLKKLYFYVYVLNTNKKYRDLGFK